MDLDLPEKLEAAERLRSALTLKDFRWHTEEQHGQAPKVCNGYRTGQFDLLQDLGPRPSLDHFANHKHDFRSCGKCSGCREYGWDMNSFWSVRETRSKRKSKHQEVKEKDPRLIETIRRRINSAGRPMYKMQCLVCGGPSTDWIKITAYVRLFSSDWDSGIRTNERLLALRATLREARNEEWWTRYSAYLASREWAEIRKLVIARAVGICEWCRKRSWKTRSPPDVRKRVS